MVRSAVETALAPVKAELAAVKEMLAIFVEYEVVTDAEEAIAMGVVTEKVTQGLAEVEELRTVTDGIVAWAGTQTTLVQALRDDLAARGVSDEDLAGLDEFIATTDAQTARLAAVLTTNTPVEGETPENPVPTDPTEGGTDEPVVEPGTGV